MKSAEPLSTVEKHWGFRAKDHNDCDNERVKKVRNDYCFSILEKPERNRDEDPVESI